MHRFGYFAAVAAALVLASGCYSVQPIATAKPVPGSRLEMSINDEGRVALGGSMGPEIKRVEGDLLSQDDNDYVLSVKGVNYLNGIFQPWKGETVRINTRMVSGLCEKKFSKGKTILFVSAVALAATAINPPWVKPAISDDSTTTIGTPASRRPIVQFRLAWPR